MEQQQQILDSDDDKKDPYVGPRRAFALATFMQCDAGDELNFKTGDTIELIEDGTMDDDPAWSKGRNVKTGKIGVFPNNFVNVIDPPRPKTQPKAKISIWRRTKISFQL